MKRTLDNADQGHQRSKKRHFDRHHQPAQQGHGGHKRDTNGLAGERKKTFPSYEESFARLPPQKSDPGPVPAFTSFTVDPGLPPLPPVQDGPLSTAPFVHKSTLTYDRSTINLAEGDVSYERLEFVGDTYIELIATRLIFSRFVHLTAGQMSQLRELLVKNETLCEYGRAYGFDKRVSVVDMERMQSEGREKGNKGFNKIVGDVFEAYVAAVILSHPEDGFSRVEKWLTALWAPKLDEAAKTDRFYNPNLALTHDAEVDRTKVYDPTAKAELQRRLLRGTDIKLVYEPYQKSIELKGAQLGQNRHYISVYLTGYGYEKKLLGKGEGKNKVEAGNWAATQAMHGDGSKNIVDECEGKMLAAKAARAAAKAENLAADAAAEVSTGS